MKTLPSFPIRSCIVAGRAVSPKPPPINDQPSLINSLPGRALLLLALFGCALQTRADFTNVPLPGVPALYNSSIAWCDYDNDQDLDVLLTGLDATDVPRSYLMRNSGNGTFSNSGVTLHPVSSSTVAWGDYDGDGWVDFLLAGATSDLPAPVTRLYHNQGDGTFGNSGVSLPGVHAGAAAWGDYDKDGDLDLLLTGITTGAGRISRIYRNDGRGGFTDTAIPLIAVGYSAVAWGDYDNDGDLDLALAGHSASGRVSRIYENNGDGSFTESGILLIGVSVGSLAWGDYDNDGYLDLFLGGSTGIGRLSRIYHNNGDGSFTPTPIDLVGLASSSSAWGDYDNDGDLDLFLMGENLDPYSLLYTNHGNGSFTTTTITFPALASGSAAWADFDNSGQLDLLVTGFGADFSPAMYLGRNSALPTNNPPWVLTGLTTRLTGRNVTLSWNPATDDHTPGAGLHYNLRLATSPGAGNKLAPMANPTNGFRRVVRLGNAARTNSWTVENLQDGTYYWSVQAIDTAFAGGPFAPEVSFTVPTNAPTDIRLNPAEFAENQPIGTTVGLLVASDLNADDSHIFTLVQGTGDADNPLFSISENELKTAASFNYEARNSYLIRIRATDPVGLYWEKPFTIVVTNVNEPPEAICIDRVVNADAGGSATMSIDNGSKDPDFGDSVSYSQSPPAPYPSGTNLVTLTVTDRYGASNSCVATVVVNDNTPPWMTWPESLSLETLPGQCEAILTYYPAVAATDNCDPAPAITSVPPAGTLLPVGRTEVTCTATDVSGNYSSCTFSVTVSPAGQEIVGKEWIARDTVPAPAPKSWGSIACSGSGVLVAALKGGHLYVSRDYGATWTEREQVREWRAVACSADGAKMAAVVYGGFIYTSADFGTSWTARQTDQSRFWSAVGCSADGTQLAATVWNGQIYTSTDSGLSWTPRESARAWSSITCSASGDVMAAVLRPGYIYSSTNAGVTWSASALDRAREWVSIACSTGGDFMVAAASGDQIYISADSGASWSARGTNRAWSAVACSQYELIVAAVEDGQLFTSTDVGQNWYARETNRAWSAITMSPGGANVYAAANDHVYCSWDQGLTWDVAARTRLWRSIATSADGTRLVAAADGDQIYTSEDSGASWVGRESNRSWYSVGSSTDGSRLVAAVNGGRIYTSTNSGETWVPRGDTQQWHGVASSADGTKLAAVAYAGQIHVSTNSGATWTARESARNWSRISCSADGTRLLASVYGGRIYTSSNSGETWTPRAFDGYWSGVASSADGTNLVAAMIGGRIYTSSDGGANWTGRESNRNWSSVASSADGARLVAAEYGGWMYTSTDFGATWTQREPSRVWAAVASSVDGSRLAGAVYGGRIYTSIPTRAEPRPPVIVGASNLVIGATTQAGAVVTFGVSATNVCQPNVPVECDPASGSTFGLGTNTVTCIAVDAFGLSATNTFTVAVIERPEKGGWGEALALDGVWDYARVPEMVLSNRAFTIELWAKRESTGKWAPFVGQGYPGAGKGLFFAFLPDNHVGFSFSNGGVYTTNAYSDSLWHHWAATYDFDTNHAACGRRIYRDGKLVASDTNTGAYTGTGPLLIGAIPWLPEARFEGSIDDVRIWNHARSAQEVAGDMLHPLTGLVPGLLAYWNLNGDPANGMLDATSNGRDGSLAGNPSRFNSTVPPWGYALLFDGSDDYVRAGSVSLSNRSFTIEAWARRATPDASHDFILSQGTDDPYCGLHFGFLGTASGNNFRFDFLGNPLDAPGSLSDTNWHHWAGTFDAATGLRCIYRDGILEASNTAAGYQGGGEIIIGSLAWSSNGAFAGIIDEVRIWYGARTQEEIQASLSHPVVGVHGSLAACWNFDEGADRTAFDSTAGLRDGALMNGPAWVPSSVGRAPTVLTLPAESVLSLGSNATATLTGSISPNLSPATAWFEWGTTISYGQRTPVFSIPSGLSAVPCASAIGGLTAGRVYHYRLVAENAFGIAFGADQTLAPPQIIPRGDDPILSRVGTVFTDPGYDVINPAGLNLGAVAMDADYHNLLLRSDGEVLGCGLNDNGQAGIPPGLGSVTRIATGGSHSLAVRADGQVVAWGNNYYGQTTVPANATNVKEVAGGYFHSLGLKKDGSVVAWGAGTFYSTYFPYFGQAAVPADATNIAAIAAGGYHSLALRSNGTVVAWGLNNEGQTSIPATATNVTAIAAGHGHNLALRGDGTVVAWGNNLNGQTIVPAYVTNIVAIAANGWHCLALRNDGSLFAWGRSDCGQTNIPASATNVVSVSAGILHNLALRADGSIVAWGYNEFGQTQGVSMAKSGTVNPNEAGVYTVTYAATNALGWAATKTRTVRVADQPALTLQPVVNITSGTVELASLVNPKGLETSAWFEWGPSAACTNMTPIITFANGFVSLPCAIQVSDLLPKQTYHYRAAASNQFGVVYSPDSLFTVFSTDPNLAGLQVAGVALEPEFSASTIHYAVTVPNEAGYLVITAVTADANASMLVRVNDGPVAPISSGSPSGPLFLLPGDNTIDLRVTAQDGVTTKVYAIHASRAHPTGSLAGPSFPPLFGVAFSQSGLPNDDQIGRASGKTWYFADPPLASQTTLYWGATNLGVRISFDDSTYDTDEVLIYRPDLSSPAAGIACWYGRTATPIGYPVYTRFVLSVTNSLTGAPIPLMDASGVGLQTNIGALVQVTPGLSWKAVLRFQASSNAAGPFEPALDFFDRVVATNIPGALASSSFGAGFYHLNFPPTLTANQALKVDRGALGYITSALLAASDLESAPAELRFTIAPQNQGGSTRNGTLRLGETDLAATNFFTLQDINNNRVTYLHSGNCETNDDFTFNVTDAHGSATPTGQHTTYTFRILIAHPNLPPVALNYADSTGLQAPYYGFLAATNGDCTPQALTFRLATAPVKGDVSLVNSNTGAFTYTPHPGQEGLDSFRFWVNDGFVDSFDRGTFTIVISNQPPLALHGSAATSENVPLTGTLTASDPDRPPQALTFAIAQNGAKGTATLLNPATGAFGYTPTPGAIGTDQFTFTASDGILVSTSAPVTVTIRPNLDEGDLLVSDWGNKQIVLVDSTGAQGVVSSGAFLERPCGLAAEPGGGIVVMDAISGLLRINPMNGSQVVLSGKTNFSSAPFGAWGLAPEPGGAILVADGTNGVVRVNPATGIPAKVATGAPLVLPVALALAPGGDLFVGDAAAPAGQPSRLVRVNTFTGTKTLVSSGNRLFLPAGVAVEASGHILVSDAPSMFGPGIDQVIRIDPGSGTQTVLTATNLLAGPLGLAVASNGKIYVANMKSASLVSVDPVTGDQTLFTSGDQLMQPAALALVQAQAPNLLVRIEVQPGQVQLRFHGRAGLYYMLERSSNLASWQEVSGATANASGMAEFVDSNAPAARAFYRVRLP